MESYVDDEGFTDLKAQSYPVQAVLPFASVEIPPWFVAALLLPLAEKSVVAGRGGEGGR